MVAYRTAMPIMVAIVLASSALRNHRRLLETTLSEAFSLACLDHFNSAPRLALQRITSFVPKISEHEMSMLRTKLSVLVVISASVRDCSRFTYWYHSDVSY